MFTPQLVLRALLSDFVEPRIALILRDLHQIITIGDFLRAWKIQKNQRILGNCFDSLKQAEYAARIMTSWLAIPIPQIHDVPNFLACFIPDVQVSHSAP
jgi:hypothetical protein